MVAMMMTVFGTSSPVLTPAALATAFGGNNDDGDKIVKDKLLDWLVPSM
jgi:hypothetical protein